MVFLTKLLSPERLHLGLSDMAIEDILDLMLGSCRRSFDVPDAGWEKFRANARGEYLEYTRRTGSMSLSENGFSVFLPLNRPLPNLREDGIAIAAFPGGTRWRLKEGSLQLADWASGDFLVKLVVLILPTSRKSDLEILPALWRKVIRDIATNERLSQIVDPTEFINEFEAMERRMP